MQVGAVGSQSSLSALYAQSYYAAKLSAARTAAANPAQPEAPVEPVSPVRAVKPDVPVRMPIAVGEPSLPTVDALNNASDNLARMRIQYPEEAAPADMQTMAQRGVNTLFMN